MSKKSTDQGNPGEDNFDGMGAEASGLLLSIWDTLPKEITELENLGDFNGDYTIPSNIKRKIFYKTLDTLKDFKLISINIEDFAKNFALKEQTEDRICEKDETWLKYLEYVTLYKKEATGFKKLLQTTDYFGAKDIIDIIDNKKDEAALNDIYHDGRILLADSSGYTCNIQQNGLKTTTISYLQNAIGDFLQNC